MISVFPLFEWTDNVWCWRSCSSPRSARKAPSSRSAATKSRRPDLWDRRWASSLRHTFPSAHPSTRRLAYRWSQLRASWTLQRSSRAPADEASSDLAHNHACLWPFWARTFVALSSRARAGPWGSAAFVLPHWSARVVRMWSKRESWAYYQKRFNVGKYLQCLQFCK